MIGGNTATILEGKIIQYGKTLDVYNKPENLTSAKVFSDPPMNIAEISKSGDTCKLTDNNVQWKSNLKIKDLTGAGDLFAAGYLHGVINQLNVKECLIKGTELSSKIIQKIGARI